MKAAICPAFLIGNCAGHIILTFAIDQEQDEMIIAVKLIRDEVIKKLIIQN